MSFQVVVPPQELEAHCGQYFAFMRNVAALKGESVAGKEAVKQMWAAAWYLYNFVGDMQTISLSNQLFDMMLAKIMEDGQDQPKS